MFLLYVFVPSVNLLLHFDPSLKKYHTQLAILIFEFKWYLNMEYRLNLLENSFPLITLVAKVFRAVKILNTANMVAHDCFFFRC